MLSKSYAGIVNAAISRASDRDRAIDDRRGRLGPRKPRLRSARSDRSGHAFSLSLILACLMNFFVTRSRLSLEIWSMNKTPLRWSISCWRAVDSKP